MASESGADHVRATLTSVLTYRDTFKNSPSGLTPRIAATDTEIVRPTQLLQLAAPGAASTVGTARLLCVANPTPMCSSCLPCRCAGPQSVRYSDAISSCSSSTVIQMKKCRPQLSECMTFRWLLLRPSFFDRSCGASWMWKRIEVTLAGSLGSISAPNMPGLQRTRLAPQSGGRSVIGAIRVAAQDAFGEYSSLPASRESEVVRLVRYCPGIELLFSYTQRAAAPPKTLRPAMRRESRVVVASIGKTSSSPRAASASGESADSHAVTFCRASRRPIFGAAPDQRMGCCG